LNWKKPFDELELVLHTDPRGSLFEVLRFEDFNIPEGGYVYTFSINPHYRRGDHYHHKKEEWFTCVYGTAKVLLSTVDGKHHRVIELSADKPSLVYAPAGTTHALINQGEKVAVLVSYGTIPHVDEDKDTFYQKACPDLEIKL
jgi:oxalate decarboxylase/phosphoglucose isomerase-like protein (cupin superfamily)